MKFKHFSYNDRLRLEALLKLRHTRKEIASCLGYSERTIYNELKRGYIEIYGVREYSADKAQQVHDYASSSKGAQIKLSHDYKFAEFVRDKIVNYRWSPDAVICYIRSHHIAFDVSVCTRTLYNYIEKGYIPGVTNADLPCKNKKKKSKRNPIRRNRLSNVLYRSIESRPLSVSMRDSFGHWEMDTVKGKRGTSASFLVFTERLTRYELILKMNDCTQLSVKRAIDNLEKTVPNFSNLFKTITCDNGSEFNQRLIETSCLDNSRNRTVVYFCHSYSAWERGSNENNNRLIRRFFPKGYDLQLAQNFQILEAQNWLNELPRRALGGFSSSELFSMHYPLRADLAIPTNSLAM